MRGSLLLRTIGAITDLSRVRPRKLPKLASLRLGEAVCLLHRGALRVSPDKGGHNVQVASGNRFYSCIDPSLRNCADRGRGGRSNDKMGRQSAH